MGGDEAPPTSATEPTLQREMKSDKPVTQSAHAGPSSPENGAMGGVVGSAGKTSERWWGTVGSDRGEDSGRGAETVRASGRGNAP